MAKITLNHFFEALRGGLGRMVFRQRPDGTIILSGAPRYRKGRSTRKQKEYREHFKTQAWKAKSLVKIHPLYAELAAGAKAKEKWLSAYNYALADCLKPPVIHRIERAAGCIRVETTDNIRVEKVCVTVYDEGGSVLERGSATQTADAWWEYASFTEGKRVMAEAWDLAGNRTELVL